MHSIPDAHTAKRVSGGCPGRLSARQAPSEAAAAAFATPRGIVLSGARTPWVAIIFTTLIAFGLIIFVVRSNASEDGAKTVTDLGGTTALLLLCVFTVVNIALLVLRRQTVDHEHFRTPTFLPYLGAITCFFLAGPWARTSEQMVQYKIAGLLLAVGIVLWAITWMTNRGVRAKKTGFRDIEHMEDDVR